MGTSLSAMADTEQKPTEITTEKQDPKVEDDSSDDEQTTGTAQGKTEAGKKTNKGEKKFKKAMTKMGLKAVPGINRVTIKKSKAFFLYIDEPEVLQSPGAENTFVVFGEAKIQDFSSALGQQEASNLGNAEKPTTQAQPEAQATQKAQADESKGDDENVDDSGVPAETIEMVMNHTSCSKAQAIKALRDNNNDSVSAIIQLTQWESKKESIFLSAYAYEMNASGAYSTMYQSLLDSLLLLQKTKIKTKNPIHQQALQKLRDVFMFQIWRVPVPKITNFACCYLYFLKNLSAFWKLSENLAKKIAIQIN